MQKLIIAIIAGLASLTLLGCVSARADIFDKLNEDGKKATSAAPAKPGTTPVTASPPAGSPSMTPDAYGHLVVTQDKSGSIQQLTIPPELRAFSFLAPYCMMIAKNPEQLKATHDLVTDLKNDGWKRLLGYLLVALVVFLLLRQKIKQWTADSSFLVKHAIQGVLVLLFILLMTAAGWIGLGENGTHVVLAMIRSVISL